MHEQGFIVLTYSNAVSILAYLLLYLQIWDTMIIDTSLKTFYDSDLAIMIEAIQRNITVFFIFSFDLFIVPTILYAQAVDSSWNLPYEYMLGPFHCKDDGISLSFS